VKSFLARPGWKDHLRESFPMLHSASHDLALRCDSHLPRFLVPRRNNNNNSLSTRFRAGIEALLNSTIFSHGPISFPILVRCIAHCSDSPGATKFKVFCVFLFCGGIAGQSFIGLSKTNLNSVVLEISERGIVCDAQLQIPCHCAPPSPSAHPGLSHHCKKTTFATELCLSRKTESNDATLLHSA
jgi:hypothetical protein